MYNQGNNWNNNQQQQQQWRTPYMNNAMNQIQPNAFMPNTTGLFQQQQQIQPTPGIFNSPQPLMSLPLQQAAAHANNPYMQQALALTQPHLLIQQTQAQQQQQQSEQPANKFLPMINKPPEPNRFIQQTQQSLNKFQQPNQFQQQQQQDPQNRYLPQNPQLQQQQQGNRYQPPLPPENRFQQQQPGNRMLPQNQGGPRGFSQPYQQQQAQGDNYYQQQQMQMTQPLPAGYNPVIPKNVRNQSQPPLPPPPPPKQPDPPLPKQLLDWKLKETPEQLTPDRVYRNPGKNTNNNYNAPPPPPPPPPPKETQNSEHHSVPRNFGAYNNPGSGLLFQYSEPNSKSGEKNLMDILLNVVRNDPNIIPGLGDLDKILPKDQEKKREGKTEPLKESCQNDKNNSKVIPKNAASDSMHEKPESKSASRTESIAAAETKESNQDHPEPPGSNISIGESSSSAADLNTTGEDESSVKVDLVGMNGMMDDATTPLIYNKTTLKIFDKKFRVWEKQFDEWKQANQNHPDKGAYKKYMDQWDQWRQQLIQQRRSILENITKARLDQLAKAEELENSLDKEEANASSVSEKEANATKGPDVVQRQPDSLEVTETTQQSEAKVEDISGAQKFPEKSEQLIRNPFARDPNPSGPASNQPRFENKPGMLPGPGMGRDFDQGNSNARRSLPLPSQDEIFQQRLMERQQGQGRDNWNDSWNEPPFQQQQHYQQQQQQRFPPPRNIRGPMPNAMREDYVNRNFENNRGFEGMRRPTDPHASEDFPYQRNQAFNQNPNQRNFPLRPPPPQQQFNQNFGGGVENPFCQPNLVDNPFAKQKLAELGLSENPFTKDYNRRSTSSEALDAVAEVKKDYPPDPQQANAFNQSYGQQAKAPAYPALDKNSLDGLLNLQPIPKPAFDRRGYFDEDLPEESEGKVIDYSHGEGGGGLPPNFIAEETDYPEDEEDSGAVTIDYGHGAIEPVVKIPANIPAWKERTPEDDYYAEHEKYKGGEEDIEQDQYGYDRYEYPGDRYEMYDGRDEMYGRGPPQQGRFMEMDMGRGGPPRSRVAPPLYETPGHSRPPLLRTPTPAHPSPHYHSNIPPAYNEYSEEPEFRGQRPPLFPIQAHMQRQKQMEMEVKTETAVLSSGLVVSIPVTDDSIVRKAPPRDPDPEVICLSPASSISRESRERSKDRSGHERSRDRDRDRGDDKQRDRRESDRVPRDSRASDERNRNREHRGRSRSRSRERGRSRSRERRERERSRDRDVSSRNRRSTPPDRVRRNRSITPTKGRRSSPHHSSRYEGRRSRSPTGRSRTDSSSKSSQPSVNTQQKYQTILVEDLLNLPGRTKRPHSIVIILRGLPGSGKSFVAKLIKERETKNGGTAPRILALDDYFITKETKQTMKDPMTGKEVESKSMEYEYDQDLESKYRNDLIKNFKKTVDNGYFKFIIIDSVNDKLRHFNDIVHYATTKRFQVYMAEMEANVTECCLNNIHNRSRKDIEYYHKNWEPLPGHLVKLDVRTLLQDEAIEDVNMEDVSDIENIGDDDEEEKKEKEKGSDSIEIIELEDEDEQTGVISKWETSEEKLNKLDGLGKRRKPFEGETPEENRMQSMGGWLANLSDEYISRPDEPGKKRVRWADIEERRQQERAREIGFVVGQTNWNRFTDPTFGSSALTRTKFI